MTFPKTGALMAEPYTESVTGIVSRVWHGDARHPHQVILKQERGTTVYYTWSEWAAAFCEEASKTSRPITLTFSETAWGKLLHDLDYALPEIPLEEHAS